MGTRRNSDPMGEHLSTRPHFHHILHLDRHGSYPADTSILDHRPVLYGGQDRLVFEGDDGEEGPLTAETFGAVLREHQIPRRRVEYLSV